MGQRMCPSGPSTEPKRQPITSGPLCALPQQAELLGRCWLLAASADSFSPSRWFAPRTDESGAAHPPPERRAFAVSRDLLSRSAQQRHPVLGELHVNVHKGLSVCGFHKLTLTAIAAPEAQRRRCLRVGGVQVPLPKLTDPADATANAAGAAGWYVVLVSRRVSIEMEPREYATAGYKRVPVRAPPTSDAERAMYGEGCITGVLYGVAAVLHTSSGGVAEALAERCTAAAQAAHVPAKVLEVQVEGVSRGSHAADTACDAPPCLLSCEAAAEECDALAALLPPAAAACRGPEATLDDVAAWAVRVHQRPQSWVPLNLFLQRYEAIGESLLQCSRP